MEHITGQGLACLRVMNSFMNACRIVSLRRPAALT